MKLLIGTSGWNYDHWKERFYPKDIPKKHWFGYYSTQFDTVEINYSFYRWPSDKTVKNWHKISDEGFIFTMKAPRIITHVKKLNEVEKWVRDFYELISLLKNKQGAILFQLPGSFKYNKDNFDKLKIFLNLLDKKKDNVVEFRDKSWWREEIYELFRKEKTIFCSVSGHGMPEDIIKTTDSLYVRFHGKDYTVDYSQKELKKYAKKIKEASPNKVYAYFNNDYNAYAPKNAQELRRLLS